MILYSSNKDDLICDFFLGSFSIAKVAIGLGRRACGFEINKQAFDYQIEKIKEIKYSSLLEKLNLNQITNTFDNKGKPIDEKLVEDIILNYDILRKQGFTKKECIDKLSLKYGRGF